MVLTKFSNAALIRAAAVMSVVMGVLYIPSSGFRIAVPAIGLGPEWVEGQSELWASYAVFGGIVLFAASFLLNLSQSRPFKLATLGFGLLAALLLIAGQLPPLFWWTLAAADGFAWSSLLGIAMHLLLAVLSTWVALLTLNGYERLKFFRS